MDKGENAMNVSCERKDARRPIRRADGAWIDVHTADGRTWSLPILDVSENGLSFGIDGTGLDGRIHAGDAFDGAELHLEGREFRGTVGVVHVTEGFSTGTVCGCTFTPDADSRDRFDRLLADWDRP